MKIQVILGGEQNFPLTPDGMDVRFLTNIRLKFDKANLSYGD